MGSNFTRIYENFSVLKVKSGLLLLHLKS